MRSCFRPTTRSLSPTAELDVATQPHPDDPMPAYQRDRLIVALRRKVDQYTVQRSAEMNEQTRTLAWNSKYDHEAPSTTTRSSPSPRTTEGTTSPARSDVVAGGRYARALFVNITGGQVG